MLMLICACGREVEFPAEEGRYACSRCGRKHVLKWHNEREHFRPAAFARLARPVRCAERVSVENFRHVTVPVGSIG